MSKLSSSKALRLTSVLNGIKAVDYVSFSYTIFAQPSMKSFPITNKFATHVLHNYFVGVLFEVVVAVSC